MTRLVLLVSALAAQAAGFTADSARGKSAQDLGPTVDRGFTPATLAATRWNHPPRTAAAGAPAVKLASGEMRDLGSSFWAAKFFEDAGHSASGSRVFASENCVLRHNDASSGAPRVPILGRDFSGASVISVLGRHGPRMLDLIKTKGLEWPRFDGAQIADLIAYLNYNKPGHP